MQEWIVAAGQDLIGLDRFRLLYAMDDADTLDRVFCRTEQAEVNMLADPITGLAACFAAKEAVLKTVGGLEQGFKLTDIEIVDIGSPRPTVRLYGSVLRAAAILDIADHILSISWTSHFVSAFAIARGSASALPR